MLLKDRVAVIYGAGGAIGGAVSQAFAAEGARVFLTGRCLGPVEAVAGSIGGSAEAALVDATQEAAIEAHLRDVMAKAGRVDVSFNAVGLADPALLGTPLADLDLAMFSEPLQSW